VLTSRLSRVLLALAVFTAAALAQVVRPKGAVVGEVTKPLPTVAPPPASAPTPPAGLGYEIVYVGPVAAAVNAGYYQVVNCPSGKKVVGGGYKLNSGAVSWSSNGPSGNNAWMVAGRTESSTPASAFFMAICIIAP